MWQNPDATAEFIEENMDGNLCRCTGYRPILDAARTLVRPGRVDGTSKTHMSPKVELIDLCWTPERWIDLALSCELMCND